MYTFLLVLHSWLRWALVIVAVGATARAVAGWRGQRAWTARDDQLGLALTIVMDLQIFVGLLLYLGFSPLTQAALQDFGAAMGNATLRFWAVEHVFGMVVALALTHLGRARSRRATEPAARHRQAAIFFALATIVLLVTIPWPFTAVGAERPWLRLG